MPGDSVEPMESEHDPSGRTGASSAPDPQVGRDVRRVVLCDRRDPGDRSYSEAAIQADGTVTVIGEDSGTPVEEFFGPGLGDYEWVYEVTADHVPHLLQALGGTPGDDVLALIAGFHESRGAAALGQLLRDEPVRAAFHSFNT
ncbi:MAG TPA: hypothetical protein VFP34_00100 [Microlunatus sp.]|nr:hypothetical protein [Microlunatus sp.]